jgi:histidinol-phosphate phosphatase family protein
VTVTRHARALADALVLARRQAQKAEYRDKILAILAVFSPPLTPSELEAALVPAAGIGPRLATETPRPRISRFLSFSPRAATARPDSFLRALLDSLLSGDLFIAARSDVPGAKREVLICDERDLLHLGPAWQVKNLSGRKVESARPVDWNDGSLWELFGPEAGAPTPASAEPAPSNDPGRLGFGAMRLSTEGRPDERDALALLLEVLEAGTTLIDTADSYCLDDSDLGHNESLIARALAEWNGPRDQVLIATKVGMRRPGGAWIPDNRPEHLLAACEASLRRLGEPLDLLQLHVIDKKVPLADTLGVFARLREAGKVRRVGISNVDAAQLEAAQAIVPIFSIQNALSFFDSTDLRSGLVETCRQHDVVFLAHSPLGGHRKHERVAGDAGLVEGARRLGLSPQQVALAWLLSFPQIRPLVGARRPESWRASRLAAAATLPDEVKAALDRRFDRLSPQLESARAAAIRRRLRPLTHQGQGEVVLFIGPPAAGKTMRVAPFLEAGYLRLNRDAVGGNLDDLLPWLRREIQAGRRSFVLDNTYASRKARRPVLEIAASAGLPVRALWLDVPIEEALYNACLRMLERHGRILEPDELKKLSRQDPNMLPPGAIAAFFQNFEEPTLAEGFATIERLAFERKIADDQVRKALLLDYDGTLRQTRGNAPFPRHPEEIEILPGRVEALARFRAEGYLLLGVSNQAGIGLGQLTADQARTCFAQTNELLGQEIPVEFCPWPEQKGGVWTRKPLPGLGVALIEKHRLDRRQSFFVGDRDSDRLFAQNLGVAFRTADEFFGPFIA